ncbi:MAG TPA: alpha/beta hydrolase [Solirubrobacteraceae bacterium]|nr:alpha/beta hydrolase [Solirubrobacteraceae bacterium]
MRHRTPDPPAETGMHEGLAYALFAPAGPPTGAVIIFHGAGSAKESHFDYARAARATGLLALSFDQRGHGASEGALDGRIVDDAAAIASLLPPGLPLALRGSSLGGYVALLAAEPMGAAAVVAICPAKAELLLRGLRREEYDCRVDRTGLERFLQDHDLTAAVARLEMPLMIQHAEGDESVPIADSRELHEAAAGRRKRLIAIGGGDHRSVQHDAELQGESLRFIRRAIAARHR